jgi:regulator of replication initiation timing
MNSTNCTTRSQMKGRSLPPATNQQRKNRMKLTTIVQERTIIEPQHQRPDEVIELNKKIDVLNTNNQKLEDCLNKLLGELRLVQQQVDLIQHENATLKAENETLKKNVGDVFDDMDYLMGKVERIDQKILSKDVEISGVPALKDEDLTDVLQLLFREVKFESSQSTVTEVYRTKDNNKNGLPGSIIATFNSSADKDRFIQETKKTQLTSSFLTADHRQRPVYVNDHMTRLNKYLFYLARNMRRQGQIKYAWFANGRVLVKEADGAPSIIVDCPKTLDKLKHRTDK